ncbi:MAG: MBL fold metallo-hydrolase [Trueperaceae bacterium]|nr:MBL fold metallo-hydrolase [Trueperaceae bacterium]
MPTLHLLGTGAVVSDPHRTATMMALDNGRGVLLVDCGGDVVPRMVAAGLDPVALDALIVTHEHADHVAGLPLMMERLWLMGRRAPVPVYGIAPALAQAMRVHDAFDVSGFDGYGGLEPHEVPHERHALVLRAHGWHVRATPGRHAVPVVGLRFEDEASGRVATYAGDTAPAPDIVALARASDLLVHEATGEGSVHSSAAQAARACLDAGAGRLILVHLPPAAQLERDLPAARALVPDLVVGEESRSYPY